MYSRCTLFHYFSSPTQLLGIAQNALQTHQERCLDANTPTSPLILNCLTGSERSELLAIAICALMGTQNKRPILISMQSFDFNLIYTEQYNCLLRCGRCMVPHLYAASKFASRSCYPGAIHANSIESCSRSAK